MIYEMRTYETMPGELQKLNDRFEHVTMGYFEKYNIRPIGFWTEDVGANNRLVYLLAFDNLAERDNAWARFRADKERIKAFAESEKDGPLVAKVYNTILKPTSYSQLK